jgi:hypothetical protein
MTKKIYTKIYTKISNKTLYAYAFISVLVISFIGPRTFAAGLVPCEGIDDCNFATLVKLLNNIVSFIMFRLPIILLVIVFAWNGVMLIYKSDRAGAVKDIKKNLWNVLVGYLLIVGAYIIVKTFIVLIAGQELSFKVFFN